MGVNQQLIALEYLPAHLMEHLLDIHYQTRLVFLCVDNLINLINNRLQHLLLK